MAILVNVVKLKKLPLNFQLCPNILNIRGATPLTENVSVKPCVGWKIQELSHTVYGAAREAYYLQSTLICTKIAVHCWKLTEN